MNEFQETHELLSKEDSRNEKVFKLINGNEVLIEGPLTKVAFFIGNNELFDITNANNGKHLANEWYYATEKEIASCIYQAKLNSGFTDPIN